MPSRAPLQTAVFPRETKTVKRKQAGMATSAILFTALGAGIVGAAATPATFAALGKEQRGAKMQALNLTEAQRAQFEALRNEAKALRAKAKDSQDRSALREDFKSLKERAQSILTPEQKAKLEAMCAEARTKRLDRMDEKLGLSDAQRAQMERLMETKRAQFEALRKNEAISDEDRRAEFKVMAERYRSEFQNLLTEAQRKQMEEARSKLRDRIRERMGQRRGEGRGERQSTPPARPTSLHI